MHAFVSIRLDYCNALYFGASQDFRNRLQLVQDAVARFVTGKHKYEHISPISASLRWLPVRFRIDFKLL